VIIEAERYEVLIGSHVLPDRPPLDFSYHMYSGECQAIAREVRSGSFTMGSLRCPSPGRCDWVRHREKVGIGAQSPKVRPSGTASD
jgi:hypothetical protein